jgi:hypothetical protein
VLVLLSGAIKWFDRIMVGGSSSGESYDEMLMLTPSLLSSQVGWRSLARLPSSRMGHSVAMTENGEELIALAGRLSI